MQMKNWNSAFFILPSALKNWLPDMDLNHDKQIQSLLCYRYTIGQAGALGRLKGFPGQSSCQTGSTLKKSNGVYARPHPGPLPREEGEAGKVAGKFVRRICNLRFLAARFKPKTTTSGARIAINRQIILPLLVPIRNRDVSPRAGVRADATTDFSGSRITHHASRN
jgi:hypothetical protein